MRIKLGTPVVFELPQRLKSFDEMVEKMGEVAVEPKYDGTRLQIHFRKNESVEVKGQRSKVKSKESATHLDKEEKQDWQMRTFTRNLEENSHMFPELYTIGDQLLVDEVILDCEAVGVDPKTGKMAPFQVTMTRKRKHAVEEQKGKVPLKFMVFDILYVKRKAKSEKRKTTTQKLKVRDGDVHGLPLRERREILESILKRSVGNSSSSEVKRSRDAESGSSSGISTRSIKSDSGPLEVVPQMVTDDSGVLRKMHNDYLKQGLEGVVVKRWDSPYVPGRKGWNWVKMKEEEGAKAGLSDTLDCVVMGYNRGKGQRTKFGVGAFLVGVLRHPELVSGFGRETKKLLGRSKGIPDQSRRTRSVRDDISYVTVSKIGTGLTDEQFEGLYKRLKKLEVKKKPKEYEVDKNLVPDVWVKPELVVEIAADNITKSRVHSSGYGLRFPRLVKFRDDKGAEQSSSLEEVERLFDLQK
jgi:DNA ligase-1